MALIQTKILIAILAALGVVAGGVTYLRRSEETRLAQQKQAEQRQQQNVKALRDGVDGIVIHPKFKVPR